MSLSVLQRVSAADIVEAPFPHLVVQDALPADLYDRLQREYPPLEKVSRNAPITNNSPYLASAHHVVDPAQGYPELWREFFSYHVSRAFHADIERVWGAAIAKEYPAFWRTPFSQRTIGTRTSRQDARQYDLVYDCQFVVNSPVTIRSSVRTPHVDSTHTLVAGILYFRSPGDMTEGGDLTLYKVSHPNPLFDGKRFIDESYVTPFKVVPYAANTLVMWLNTPSSIHGVSPRSVTPLTRQFVNFIAESYSVAPRGFFTLPGVRPSRSRLRSVVSAALRRAKLIHTRAQH